MLEGGSAGEKEEEEAAGRCKRAAFNEEDDHAYIHTHNIHVT